MNTFENVIYQQIPSPKMDCSGIPVLLNDETMEERYEKVLGRMKEEDCLKAKAGLGWYKMTLRQEEVICTDIVVPNQNRQANK